MEVISHRGLWRDPVERNTLDAFERSFKAGFAAEVDVRDLDGELVVSHDPPRSREVTLDAVVASYRRAGCPGTLAINVKSDGLATALRGAMADVPSWFAFDMSVPDTLQYDALGLPFYVRLSEYEPEAPLAERAGGVWLDCFVSDWITRHVVEEHIQSGRSVCLVSPELHGRDPQKAWAIWQTWDVRADPRFQVCTDLPYEVSEVLR